MEKIVRDAMSNGAKRFLHLLLKGIMVIQEMPSRLSSNDEMSRLVQAMAHQGRGIFMLTKSNNTSIKDIEKILWVI